MDIALQNASMDMDVSLEGTQAEVDMAETEQERHTCAVEGFPAVEQDLPKNIRLHLNLRETGAVLAILSPNPSTLKRKSSDCWITQRIKLPGSNRKGHMTRSTRTTPTRNVCAGKPSSRWRTLSKIAAET